MAINRSRLYNPQQWEKWRRSGALGGVKLPARRPASRPEDVEKARAYLAYARDPSKSQGVWIKILSDDLIKSGRVTLEELGLTQGEFDTLSHQIDVSLARTSLALARDSSEDGSQVTWIQFLRDDLASGRVSLEELGLTQGEFDTLSHQINVASARAYLVFARDPSRCQGIWINIVRERIADDGVTLEELGLTRLQFETLAHEIATGMFHESHV